MTKKEKRFDKIIFGLRKEYRFEEILNFLDYCGYKGKQTSSSHITFRRNDYEPIIIVVHHNQIKKIYVRKMVRILRKQQII
jgi:predicted RNA binding protein YcfA (HicA-like mRNA interferase family)